MEEWRDIEGYEGLYQVSNYGRIRSLGRTLIEKNTNKTKILKGKILKLAKCTNGYEFVQLYKNGKAKQHLVHRLVAKAFIPNHNNLPQVNHKDEKKTNNKVDNLEWCTQAYNNTYNNRHIKIGKQLHNRKDISKVVYQYKNDKLNAIYPSISEAARDNRVLVASIIQCCHGGFNWKGKWFNKHSVKGCNYSFTPL